MVLFLVFLTSVLTVVLSASDYTVTINVRYPKTNLKLGQEIYIRGDSFGLNWNSGKLMTLTSLDTFTITLNGKFSGVFSFKALANDNSWQIGSNSMYSFTDNITPSNVNITTYPWFYTTSGVYLYTKRIYSTQLSNERNLVTYLPPSYYENKYKYYNNVIIMHDGQNLFNASTSFAGVAWDCQDTVNEQVNGGNMEEVIIIGIDNTPSRIYEYDYDTDLGIVDGGGADYYNEFIIDTVIPLMKSTYRISSDLNNYGMIGSSLGGILSCYLGWINGKIYNKLGCMSSSFWWNDFDFNTTILYQIYNITPKYIYIDVGALEPQSQIIGAQSVTNHLQLLGYKLNNNLEYYLDPIGQHNEASWGRRFYRPMQFLYPPQIYPAQ